MARWLVKEEPTHYSFADLEADGRTAWEGVKNPLARRHLAAMRKGDLVLFYHTGEEKRVVGIARAASDPRPERDGGDPRAVAVDLEPVERLPAPAPLAALKARPALASFPLVRMPRLSVMPVGDAEWEEILRVARKAAAGGGEAGAAPKARARSGKAARRPAVKKTGRKKPAGGKSGSKRRRG